jgi:hypothetical protein
LDSGKGVNGVKVWVDNSLVGYSNVTVNVTAWNHDVKVENTIYVNGQVYYFLCWNGTDVRNPTSLHIDRPTTVTAIYGPSPPGGCPFVYSWNGTGYAIDNNLLPASAKSNGTEVEDYYRLEQTPAPLYEQGIWSLYSLMLGEFQKEHSYLDQTELITIDHQPGTNVAASPFGEILTYGNPSAPASAVDEHGISWLEELRNAGDSYYEGHYGSYVVADFGEVNTETAKLVMRADRPPLKQSIHVQVLDSAGSWVDVVSIIPRSYWATEIVDLSSYLPDSGDFKVRLYFTDCHKLDSVGLDTTSQAQIDVQNAPLLLAYHSHDGIVTQKLLHDDNIRAELMPGQQVVLVFLAARPQGNHRTFIIHVRGYYVTITG